MIMPSDKDIPLLGKPLEYHIALGGAIRTVREYKGISQNAFTGLKAGDVAKIEGGNIDMQNCMMIDPIIHYGLNLKSEQAVLDAAQSIRKDGKLPNEKTGKPKTRSSVTIKKGATDEANGTPPVAPTAPILGHDSFVSYTAELIGLMLRVARLRHRETQDMAAQNSGISRDVIGEIEKGKCNYLGQIESYARYLGFPDQESFKTAVQETKEKFWGLDLSKLKKMVEQENSPAL